MGDSNGINSRKVMSKLGKSPPDRIYPTRIENDDEIASLSSTLASSITGGSFSTPPSYSLTGKDLLSNNVESGRGLSISPSTPKEWETNYKGYLSQFHVNNDKADTLLAMPNIGIGYQSSLREEIEKRSGKAPRDTLQNGTNFPQHLRTQGSEHITSVVPLAAKTDKAVHGGKLFKALFGKKDRRHTEKNPPSDLDHVYHGQRKDHKDSMDQSSTRSKSFNSFEGANLAAYRLRQAQLTHNDDSAVKAGSPFGTVITPGGEIRTYTQGGYVDTNQHDTTNRARKLKFTEMHNSKTAVDDSASPYLGDDKSVHYGQHFANTASPSESPPNEYIRSQRAIQAQRKLTPVTEDELAKSKKSILKPIEGVHSWSKNGDHLVLPAIMEMSPQASFWFVEELENSCHNIGDTFSPEQSTRSLAFGKHILGKATQVRSKTSSSSVFVLRQNYLFEFQDWDNLASQPRGVAFLQDSIVSILNDTIKLEYYERSNKSRSKLKKIILQVEPNDAGVRERWVTSLRAAAKLRIEHLYEYDASDGGKELGKGRYSTIRPARRRRSKAGPPMSWGDSTGENMNGIMKKHPSFSSLASVIPPSLMDDDYECALKIVDKASFWERVRKGKERADALVREISVQATLMTYDGGAQNSLRILSFFETFDHVVLELELLEGSDLFQHISRRGILTETEAAEMMFDLLTCIAAMNKAGVAHRDLKPANILMGKPENRGTVKLGDFGMATFVGEENLIYGRCGTPGYVAPEIFMAGKNEGYRNNVDVFSAGVTLYVLLSGYEPFYGETEKELIRDNKEAKVEYPESEWKTVSIEGHDLIEKMLQRDPTKRITASDALLHPWITRRAFNTKKDKLFVFPPDGVACCVH